MAIQFCGPCGDTLPVSLNKEVTCDCCGTINKNKLLSIVTVSSTDKFPSELRQKRQAIVVPTRISAIDTWSTTDTQCPKCHAKEVRYTALQLRSADEGTTMFYFCPVCSEKWNEDN